MFLLGLPRPARLRRGDGGKTGGSGRPGWARLYHLTLNELVEFDPDRRVVEEAIAGISDEKQRQIDWTAVWGKRYPVLTTYQETVDVTDYAPRFTERCWTA